MQRSAGVEPARAEARKGIPLQLLGVGVLAMPAHGREMEVGGGGCCRVVVRRDEEEKRKLSRGKWAGGLNSSFSW